MSDEILKLSQWLHEKGFEPDASWNEPSIILLKYFDEDEKAEFYEDMKKGMDTPYFTLNRALELLPNVIRESGYKYEFNMYQTCDGFVLQYASACGAVQKDFESESSNCDGMSIHLAALRLLVKVVSQGYLKGESDAE